MKLTPEQKAAIHHEGHVLLVACPGSGKTRTIVAKLLKCAAKLRGTPRRVACLTYTNTAVQEIESRMRVFGSTGDEEICEISTIHAFCMNNILQHFYWKVEDYCDGFTVLPSDAEEYLALVDEIANKFSIGQYPRQLFDSLNRTPDGDPIVPEGIPSEAAKEFWQQLRKRRYIDFCNIVYYSYCLLRDEPTLARNLASRFAWMLVDEFQDTSALQVEILSLLNAEGLSEFFLVGDPEQSIYSFAGAERNLMFTFSKAIAAKQFPLSGNFRCSPPIVEAAERLIPRQPSMFSAGEAKQFVEAPSYEHSESAFTAITDSFLPVVEALKIPLGDAAILAPTWFQLLPLGRQLRQYGVPIVGPGARPYRRRHLFAGLAEQVCAYIENPVAERVPHLERELFYFLQNVTGKSNFGIFSFNGRRVLFQILDEGLRLREQCAGARDWLLAASQTFAEILLAEGLLPRISTSLITESADDMLADMRRNNVDTANLLLSDLGMFADPAHNLKLMTMHGAKGREFSAVAIVAALDGMIPYHNYYNPLTQPGLEEGRRLFYVSITRAKRLLMLFSHDNQRQPSRFISELAMN